MTAQNDALHKLTPKCQRFVLAYVSLGGKAFAAAKMAGYSNPDVECSRLMRKPDVLAAVQEQTQRTLNGQVALGAKVLSELAESAASEQVRFNSAQALLDRGGLLLKAMSQVDHLHLHAHATLTDTQLADAITQGFHALPAARRQALLSTSSIEPAPLEVEAREPATDVVYS